MQRYLTTVAAGLLFMAMASLLLVGGCAMFEPKETLAAPVMELDGRLVESISGFGFNLLHQLRLEKPQENILISPASVATALAMTYNGAGGDTARAMAEALLLQGMRPEEVNKAFADLQTILQNPDPQVELSMANSLWAREGVPFNEDFLQRSRDYFDAEITQLDFNLPGAAGAINDWVKEKTKGKIDQMVQAPIDPLTVLFLLNAIHFKGHWSVPFDEQKTRDMPFTLEEGTVIEHPVMFSEGDYRILQTDSFQAAALPYGKNGRVNMYLFLPALDSSLAGFYAELNRENWDSWMKSFREQQAEIGLPRFKFGFEATLNDALKALGMGPAFDPGTADFSGMRSQADLYISEVKHKTFIEVNEEGAEAAAATSVEMRLTAMPEVFTLIIDRPYFFAIVDDQTGAILFMGSVSDPSAG